MDNQLGELAGCLVLLALAAFAVLALLGKLFG